MVGLEPVAQPGLGDAVAVLDLLAEPDEVRVQVGVDALDEGGGHAAEQDAAEAGGGVDREVAPAERDPPGGSDGPRLVHLQLRERHP